MSGLQAPKENGTAEVEPTCTGSENSEALTAREVELILDTWSDVQKNLQEAGRVMFVKLFEIAPELKDLFSFEEDDMEGLEKHGLQVMNSIDHAISILDKPEELKENLISLGIVHDMCSVQVKSFAPVGVALIHTLEVGLGEKFTSEVKTAWVKLYSAVQQYMTLGMTQGVDA